MIKGVTSASGKDYIRLTWIKPKYNPNRYKVRAVCTLWYARRPYASKQLLAKGDINAIKVESLSPASTCELTLFARYNLASQDDGVNIIVETKPEAREFIINVLR